MAGPIVIFTMGASKKDARAFFAALREAGVRRVVDIRLKNQSALGGFTRGRDLAYFLQAVLGLEYVHRPELAPTRELLTAYRGKHIDWPEYERRFAAILAERRPEDTLSREELNGACLLCSEPKPDQCHRRLVAEHLRRAWDNVEIRHL
jgi:uncharacterized protein (DUF488 family)